MRIITCNVNGIRSASKKEFWGWLKRQKADFVCLQETRAFEDQFPDEASIRGYHRYLKPAVRPGYSGVALYSKHKPDQVIDSIDLGSVSDEGRYLQFDLGKLSVISVYFPSGSSGETRQELKYEFLDIFYDHLIKLKKQKRQCVICGDFNIAHKQIDLKNWRSNQKNSGFLPEERAWMDKIFDELKYVDAFRVVNDKPEQYTWWSNRGRARENNVGWRLDYHVVSSGLRGAVKNAKIYTRKNFSDHAPLTIDYDYEL